MTDIEHRRHHEYTPQQIEWMRDRYETMTNEELVDAWPFGYATTETMAYLGRRALGLHKTRETFIRAHDRLNGAASAVLSDREVSEALVAYENGVAIKTLASRYGVDKKTLERAFRRMGDAR